MKGLTRILASILISLFVAFSLCSCDIKGTVDQYSQNLYDMIMSNQEFLKEDEQFKEQESQEEKEQEDDTELIPDENA
ncbi:MAG: hypothetical protein IJ004_01575 [Clostridia bacterium]|nr:hypothetical protein [Clostridia bacterium]